MTGPEHFAPIAWQIIANLKPQEHPMPQHDAPTDPERADNIRNNGKPFDYEQAALDAIAAAHDAGHHTLAEFHLAQAQVWATLHHARVAA